MIQKFQECARAQSLACRQAPPEECACAGWEPIHSSYCKPCRKARNATTPIVQTGTPYATQGSPPCELQPKSPFTVLSWDCVASPCSAWAGARRGRTEEQRRPLPYPRTRLPRSRWLPRQAVKMVGLLVQSPAGGMPSGVKEHEAEDEQERGSGCARYQRRGKSRSSADFARLGVALRGGGIRAIPRGGLGPRCAPPPPDSRPGSGYRCPPTGHQTPTGASESGFSL